MYFTLSGDFLPEGRTYFVQKLLENGHHVEAHITENTNFLIISKDAINYKKVKEATLKNIPIIKKENIKNILEKEDYNYE
jgi:NAD-dependent DNA ligase